MLLFFMGAKPIDDGRGFGPGLTDLAGLVFASEDATLGSAGLVFVCDL